jgi:hypothetical protein
MMDSLSPRSNVAGFLGDGCIDVPSSMVRGDERTLVCRNVEPIGSGFHDRLLVFLPWRSRTPRKVRNLLKANSLTE